MAEFTITLECESNKFDSLATYQRDEGGFTKHEDPFAWIGVFIFQSADGKFIFDCSPSAQPLLQLQEAPVCKEAYFSYECDLTSSNSTDEIFLFRRLIPDGVWDVDAPSAAEWRGSFQHCLRANVYRVGGIAVSSGSGGLSFDMDMREKNILSGATVGPVHESGQYFVVRAGTAGDIEKIRVNLDSQGESMAVYCELWSTEDGGGGRWDRKPLALLHTSAAKTQVYSGTVDFFFTSGVPLVAQGKYFFAIKSDTLTADGTSRLLVRWRNVVLDFFGNPLMGMNYGQDQGLTFNNYPAGTDLPNRSDTPVSGEWSIRPDQTQAGVVYDSENDGPDAPVDLVDIVNASIADWVEGGPRRIGLHIDVTLGSQSFISMTGEDAGEQNPQLRLTFDELAVCFATRTEAKRVVSATTTAGLIVDAASSVNSVVSAKTQAVRVVDALSTVTPVVHARTEAC